MFLWRTFVRMKNIVYPRPLTHWQCQNHHSLIQAVIQKQRRRCQMCGADEADTCPYQHRLIRLSVGFAEPPLPHRVVVETNLMTLCSTCVSGLRSLARNDLSLSRRSHRKKRQTNARLDGHICKGRPAILSTSDPTHTPAHDESSMAHTPSRVQRLGHRGRRGWSR